jgi:acetylornithine deacetylase/succinyl-diaminopimelate desuccinylase-like protein
MREAALEVSIDGSRNLFGRRGDARVWAGSHLDGVPNGGRFDGALGVSHSPDELSSPDDIALAVDALTDTLSRIAR